jgi:predicted Fe-S protein YdhL (DUF1289 family)
MSVQYVVRSTDIQTPIGIRKSLSRIRIMDDNRFDWNAMSPEEKRAFIRDSVERHHKEQYLWALECAGVAGPTWEDLTEEQRENIREENRRYQREMQEFGASLRDR